MGSYSPGSPSPARFNLISLVCVKGSVAQAVMYVLTSHLYTSVSPKPKAFHHIKLL